MLTDTGELTYSMLATSLFHEDKRVTKDKNEYNENLLGEEKTL